MSDNLQKHYSLLSRHERLTLFLRAAGRDDQAEMDAVLAATPMRNISMREFFPEVETLQTMSLLHLIEQVDNLLALLLVMHDKDESPQRMLAMQRVAQLFLVTEEAWRAFVGEYGLAYDRLLNDLAGPLLPYFSLIYSSGLVETAAHWDEGLPDAAPPMSAPTLADKMKELRGAFALHLARTPFL
jgi:hypothetical protein